MKKSISCILFSLVLGLGCSFESSTPKAKVTVEKSEGEQIVLNLRSQQTPLQVFEVDLEDLSPNIVEKLQDPEKSIAIGNLLRSPCIEEWYQGVTVNQSIQKEKCKKSLEWLFMADKYSSENISVDEVLFTMVSPGPFIPSLESEGVVVIVESDQLYTDLLQTRKNEFMKQAIKVRLYVETDSKMYEMDFKCVQKGQILSDMLEDDNCIGNTIENISHPIQQAAMNQPKPVWLIQGYRVSGFQSIEQFNRMLKLP